MSRPRLAGILVVAGGAMIVAAASLIGTVEGLFTAGVLVLVAGVSGLRGST